MTDQVQTPSGIPLEPVYGPADRIGEPPAPGTYPFTRGNFASGLPRQAVDVPAVFRLRDCRGVQSPLPVPARPGRHGPVGRAGPAHAVRLRLRRPRGRRGGRPGRRRGRHARRRRDPVRRHPAGQDQHQLHDQRHRGDPAGVLRRRRREEGRAARQAHRHDPERHPQGVRVARHLDLAAGAVAAPDRRHDRVLRRRGAEVQRDLGGRRALPRRRRQRGPGDGVHPRRRRHVLRHGGRTRPDDHRRVRPADLVLLLHARRLLRGDREVPGGPSSLGDDRARTLRCAATTRRRCSGSAACPAVRRCMRRRRRTTSCGSPTRRWRRCSAACSRCSPPHGTSRSRCPARSRRRWRCAPSRSWPTKPASTKVADPLGGSYFVEALTDATEERIIEIMDDLERHGGMVRAIEDGYLQGLIADEAFKHSSRGRVGGAPGRRRQQVRRPTSRRTTSRCTSSTPRAATCS